MKKIELGVCFYYSELLRIVIDKSYVVREFFKLEEDQDQEFYRHPLQSCRGMTMLDFEDPLVKDLLRYNKNGTVSRKLEKYILNSVDIAIKDHENDEKNRKYRQDNKKIKNGYIYIVKSLDLYKIGRTIDKKSRIDGYRTENPHGIEIILLEEVNDYIKAESELLSFFNEKLKKGNEWFNLDKNDIDKAKTIIKKYGTTTNV
jgi:hypothetical protein